MCTSVRSVGLGLYAVKFLFKQLKMTGSGQSLCGSGRVGSSKSDPRPTLGYPGEGAANFTQKSLAQSMFPFEFCGKVNHEETRAWGYSVVKVA